ncbi:hypothetical protein D3C71_1229250 [compost metagenome]
MVGNYWVDTVRIASSDHHTVIVLLRHRPGETRPHLGVALINNYVEVPLAVI